MLCLACGCATMCYAQGKVAIYVDGSIDESCKSVISAKVSSRISRGKDYVVMERNDKFLDVLVREQDYQVSGEVRDDQIAALGQRFGVRYVAVIIATESAGYGSMAAKLIDVESGAIIKAVDTDREVKSTADWIAMANNAAYRLFTPKSK